MAVVCKNSIREKLEEGKEVLAAGVSRSGIQKARNELKQRGLLDFRERGTRATLYKITIADSGQVSGQVSVQNSNQKGNQNGGQDGAQDGGALKDIDKDIKRERSTAPAVKLFDGFWEVYPKHKNDRALAEKAYCRVLLEDCHITEDDLVAAAANYADAMKILGREGQFVRSAASFLTDSFLPPIFRASM